MRKASASVGQGVLRSSVLTGLSLAAVTGVSAAVGVIVAREFGRGADTDGFFAAFGVYVVLALAATAFRLVVLPALARARTAGGLAREAVGWGGFLAFLAVPVLAVAWAAPDWVGARLAGGLPAPAAEAAAAAIGPMALAAVLQLYAGLAASALAALDDYGTAALGYAAGSTSGLTFILLRVDAGGLDTVAWGMALNSAVCFAVPAAALLARARGRPPATGPLAARERLAALGRGIALPLVLQVLYLVCLRVASDVGVGAVTSFSYAYLVSAGLVSITAGAIALVSSVPLARAGLSAELAARHVASASWVALALVGAAAGVSVVAGGPLVELVLGDAYGGEVGSELGRLIAYLSPWMVASVGFSVSFPLLFVRGPTRGLVWRALAVLPVHLGLALGLRELFGLAGVALALALSTAIVLAGILTLLGVAERVARELLVAGTLVGAVTALAFLPGAWLGAALAAGLGVALYAAAFLLATPPPLRRAWRYMRALQ